MVDIRIRISKDKAEIVKALKDGSDLNGPFQTYADVVAFAAMLGAQRGRRIPLREVCKSDPDPIPQEHFSKHEKLIHSLAIIATQEPKILADNELCEEQRAEIFEEYANAGLELIEATFGGSVDYLEQLLLLLSLERQHFNSSSKEFNLDYFLSS